MLEIKPYPLDSDYMVYSDGRIWAKKKKKHFLKPNYNKGYQRVCLSINKKKKNITVHRIVAETFLENPDNLPQINHKDENRDNNDVSNLEYCTAEYNCNYGTRIKRVSETRKERNCKGKPVYQLDEDMNIITEYPSASAAARALNCAATNISVVCRNPKKHPRSNGYCWRFVEDYHKGVR